jgi:hypothetical protein
MTCSEYHTKVERQREVTKKFAPFYSNARPIARPLRAFEPALEQAFPADERMAKPLLQPQNGTLFQAANRLFPNW